MKYTLLEMVQAVLSSIDGDEVSNIADTVESSQVIEIVKQNYFDILGSMNLPEHKGLFQLEASGDNTKPVLMIVPDNVLELDWIKYNTTETADTKTEYTPMHYVEPEQFLSRMFSLNTSDSDVTSMTLALGGPDVMTVYYKNDKMPEYWTSFDERNLVFDSYNSTEESTLQKTNTYCFGTLESSFTESNTFVFDLDEKQHQLLLQESKRQAAVELRQAQNPNSEEKARRNRIRGLHNKNSIDSYEWQRSVPDYGRKGRI